MPTPEKDNDDDRLDVLHGVEAIANYVGRKPRQTRHALAKGHIPGTKISNRWVASKRKLRERFGA